jgi:peptidoglycan hydrolase CwlO-like protein
MAEVSISEAARLVKLSRSHFYKTYINTGRISVGRNFLGKPQVDTSELLRVFGKIGDDTDGYISTHEERTIESIKIQALQQEIEHLKSRLEDKDERINDLKQAMALIEHQKSTKKRFWFW